MQIAQEALDQHSNSTAAPQAGSQMRSMQMMMVMMRRQKLSARRDYVTPATGWQLVHSQLWYGGSTCSDAGRSYRLIDCDGCLFKRLCMTVLYSFACMDRLFTSQSACWRYNLVCHRGGRSRTNRMCECTCNVTFRVVSSTLCTQSAWC